MGRPKSLTLQQRIELRRLRGDGATLLECAVWFRISRASMSRYLAIPTARRMGCADPDGLSCDVASIHDVKLNVGVAA